MRQSPQNVLDYLDVIAAGLRQHPPNSHIEAANYRYKIRSGSVLSQSARPLTSDKELSK